MFFQIKKMLPISLSLVTLLGLQLGSSAPAAAPVKPLAFEVKASDKNLVEFNSNAPVEVIHGTTHDVNGAIQLDPSFKFDAKHPFRIAFSVDLRKIDTGIPLRNEHMRDNFLETGKYPTASFKATTIHFPASKPDLKKSQTVHLVADGAFTVHGETVSKSIPLTVVYTPATAGHAAQVEVKGQFKVPLAEHHIKRPEAIFVKLADTILVNVDLVAVAK